MQLRTTAVVISLFTAALFVGCDKRAPRDILFGTWQETFPVCIDCVRWITFRPDATVVSFTSSLGAERVDYEGRWYAGGKYIYIGADGKTQIWQIVDIQPHRLRLRHAKEDYVFERVQRDPPNASNQAMQLTASKSAIYASRVCHRTSMLRFMHRGLAAADLVSR